MKVETNNNGISNIKKEPEEAVTNNNMIKNLAFENSNQEKLILNHVSLASVAPDVHTEMNFPSLNY